MAEIIAPRHAPRFGGRLGLWGIHTVGSDLIACPLYRGIFDNIENPDADTKKYYPLEFVDGHFKHHLKHFYHGYAA